MSIDTSTAAFAPEGDEHGLARPAPGRVLHVFQPTTGGVPGYVAALTEGLLERGWDVTVFGPAHSSATERIRVSGARFVAASVARHPSPSDLEALRTVARLCRGADVVHGHSTKASLLTAGASRLTGVPSVYSPHFWAFESNVSRPVRWSFRTFERAMARTHEEIIAVAGSERRAAADAAIAPQSGAVRLVRTGLRPVPEPPRQSEARRALGLPTDGVVVAWIGRLAPQKRPQDLAPLAAALAPKGIQLVALGSGLPGSSPGRALLEKTGTILRPGTDPLLVYAAADMFVQTSAWEAAPLTVLEAMRAGLPVIAYDVGGLDEQVDDGVTGYLVAPDTIDALARCAVALAQSPEDRARMGEAARRRFDELFTFDRMLDAIEWTYFSARSVKA